MDQGRCPVSITTARKGELVLASTRVMAHVHGLEARTEDVNGRCMVNGQSTYAVGSSLQY